MLNNKNINKSYSPNNTIDIDSNLNKNNDNKSIIHDENLIYNHFDKKLNFSKSSKLLVKVKKEKNDIIKKQNIRQYLTHKNIKTIPNKRRRRTFKRNKSFDSIMPPNNFDEIFKKNFRLFKLLNKDD